MDEYLKQRLAEGYQNLTAIVLLLLLGLAVIVGIVLIRHFFRRWDRQDQEHKESSAWSDAWAESGERLQVEPEPEDDDDADEGESRPTK